MPITDEQLRAVEKLIITPEGARIWRRLAFGWAKLGWLREDTLVRFTIMCSSAGLYWDMLREARSAKDPTTRSMRQDLAEKARAATRHTAVELGLIPKRRGKLGEVNERGEDVDLLRVLSPTARSRRRPG